MEPIKNGYILTDDEVARLTAPVSQPAPVPTPAPVSTNGRIFIPGVYHEYSTFYPGSIDHAWFLFLHPGGSVGLYGADGSLRKILPSAVNHHSQPRWLRQHGHQFYYLTINEIRRYDVLTDQDILIRKFDKPPYVFPSISSLGEADISFDGDHLVLCSGNFVFVYKISTDRIVDEFHVVWPVDNLMLTPDNDVIVSYYSEELSDGTYKQRGTFVYERSTKQLRKLMAAIGHQDTGKDANGDSIVAWLNSADGSGPNQTAAIACKNGVAKVNVATGQQTCLVELDWSLAGHVTWPDLGPYCYVSTHDRKNPNSTVKYGNEILQVAKDGSGATSLGKHGALNEPYEQQPRASVSHDGKRVIWTTKGGVVIRDV